MLRSTFATGVAWQSVEARVQCGGTLPAWCLVGNVRDESAWSLRPGWTVGGGLETRIAGNWLARLEYRYADFGTFVSVPIPQLLQVSRKSKETMKVRCPRVRCQSRGCARA